MILKIICAFRNILLFKLFHDSFKLFYESNKTNETLKIKRFDRLPARREANNGHRNHEPAKSYERSEGKGAAGMLHKEHS